MKTFQFKSASQRNKFRNKYNEAKQTVKAMEKDGSWLSEPAKYAKAQGMAYLMAEALQIPLESVF